MALEFDITGDNTAFIRSMNEVRQQIRSTQSAIEMMNVNGARTLNEMKTAGEDFVTTLNRIGAAAGIAFSVQQAKSFVDKIVETRGYFQDIESSMKVFLGNEEKAKQFTDKLRDYAYYNMFEFSDLATASKQMIAYGHNVESIIPRLDQLSNVARGTSAPLMEMVNAYNRAKNLGGLGARDLQSWAAKGLVVKDILAEMGEKVKNNKVTFEQLNKVLDHVTGEGGMFHDLMGEQLNNITAEQGQLEDNLTAMYNEIGEKYQDVITGVIKAESFLVDHYKEIAATIGTLIAAYGEYRVVLMASNAIPNSKQKLNFETESKGLDEAIAKYKEILPEKEKAANADLVEAVAKKKLTEEQAALIAAKRAELSNLQIDKETLDVTAREAEAKRLLLDIDLQDKVATKELTQAQAESIQKRREELEVIEKQVAARKEELLKKNEEKMALNEKDIASYKSSNENLGKDKDVYSKRINEIDKNIINLSSDEIKNASAINILKKEKADLEDKILKADERIKENYDKMYDLDKENVKLANEQLDIQIRYASNEEKMVLLAEKKKGLEENLSDAKDEASIADDMLKKAKEKHEISLANVSANKERLDGLRDELQLEQRNNEERAKQGQMWKDLSALQKEVNDAETDYNTSALQESIDAKEEEAAASLAQEASEKVLNVQKEVDNVNTQIGTTVTSLNSKEKIKNIMATEGLSTAEKIHAIATTQASVASRIFNIALLQMRAALDAVKTAIMTNPLGVLVGALTIALPLLYQFISSTDDLAEKQENYNNEAREAESKVKSYVNVLNTADKKSKIYKDSVSQLERVYKDYGIEIEKVKDAQGKEITNTQALIDKHGQLLDVLRQEAVERQKYADMDAATKEYETGKESNVKDFKKRLDNEEFSESDKNMMISLIDEKALTEAGEELKKYNEILDRLKEKYGESAHRQKEAQDQLKKYQDAVSAAGLQAVEFAKATTDDKDALKDANIEIQKYIINTATQKKEQLQAIENAENAAAKVWAIGDAQRDSAARSLRYAKMSAEELKTELKHIADYNNTKINVDVLYNEVNIPDWMAKKSDKELQKDVVNYTNLAHQASKSKSGKARMKGDKSGKTYTAEEATTLATQATKEKKRREDKAAADAAEKKRKQEEADRNADKNAKDAASRRQKRSEDELKQLQEQFKTEQDRRRSLAELRIAQIQNESVKEQEAQKEASRQKWEGIASEELSAYKKLYDDAKKQFELKNKNKNKVFADTAEAKEIMDGIRAYVDYYSQRNNLARTANEELEKTNGGVKVFDEAKLDTSKEKLAGLLEMLQGIQDKKVVVESETKDMINVEVTGDVDDVKAIKQMASEDTSFTVTMKVEQIGSIEIPKDKTFTVTGRYEGADLADITKKVNSLPKTAETVINTSLGKIQKADINENATVQVETVVDSKQYDELVKKLGKDAVQKVTTEVTGDEIPTVEDKTMAVRIRVDKSKVDDLKKSVPKEMPVKIYSDAEDFKMPKIKDKVTVDVNYKVNSEELDKVKHPKGGTITYNTDVKGLDTIEKLGDKNVKITATVESDKINNFSQAVERVPKEIVVDGSKSIEEIQRMEESILRLSGKGDILDTLKKQFSNGNVNTLARPLIDASELVKKGWKDAGEGIATVFSSQYGVKDAKGKVHEILFTPILPDGTVLSQQELEDYIGNTLEGAEDILKADSKGLVIAFDVKGTDAGEKLHQLHEQLYNLPTDKLKEIQGLYNSLPDSTTKKIVVGIEQVGELPQVEDKLFTVRATYDGKEVKDGLAEIPAEANIKVTTTLDNMPAVKDGEMEITAHVTDDEYQELVKKYGKDIVQKVTLDTTDVKTGMQAVQGMDGKTVAIAIKTTGENLQTIAEDVKALDTDATLTYHINADELPQVKDNEVVEVEYKANTEQIKAAEEKLKQNPTTTITYNVVTKGYEYVERINNLPTEKTVTIRAEQIGKVEIPDVKDKAFTVTGHYDGSETDKIKEIPSKADVLVTTKVDSKQYDDLAKRFKGNVSILVDVNDKKALEQLQDIKNLHIDPKEVVFRADNKDALQAAKEIQGVHIDEQTMKVYADTEEAMKKLTAMNGMMLQPKTLSVTADTKKAKNDLMAVDGLVKDKKMSVAIKTTGDKLPEVKADDTVTYTYKANTKELEEVTPPQDATITYTVKVQGQEALQGLKVPADQTYTVTMALEKVGSIEMPKDGTFTISAHLQGEEELKKITELPKEADVTINTKLGDIKKPDIPTDATIEVTTEVSAANYEKLKAQLGEDAVQIIHTKVEGDAVPQVKDQTMTVYVKTDKTGLTNLQNVVGKDVTAKVNTKAGKVNLPKIDKNATVDVKYNVDSTQVDEAAAKLHDGTVTYHVNVEGKEQLDALGDKSISIRVDASREAQAQAKLLGEAFKQSVISAQQLSDAGLDKTFIDKLKNGTYSADELARAIVLLQNAIDGLDKNSEKYKGLYNSLDDDTKAILKNKEALIEASNANDERKKLKENEAALREYLKAYGDFQQKKKAIEEEYAEKIAKAPNAAEAMSLGREQQQKLSELDKQEQAENFEKIKAEIDWEGLFNNLGDYSTKFLESTRDKLSALLNDPSISVEDKQTIAGKINEIDSLIIEKSSGLFTGLRSYFAEQKRLQDEATIAGNLYNEALQRETEAKKNLSSAQTDVSTTIDEIGGKGKSEEIFKGEDIKSTDASKVFSALGMSINDTSKTAERLRAVFAKLAGTEEEVKEATEDVVTADGKKKNADDKAKEGKKAKDEAAKFMKGLNDDVQKIFGDLPGLLDQVGLGDTGKTVQKGLNGINDAAGAVSDFASGNYIGAISKGLSAIGNLGGAGIDLFAGGGNAEAMEAEIAALGRTNELLADAIEGLQRAIVNQNNTNAQSLDAYKRAQKAEEEREANQRQRIQDRANEYSNSGHGFLGLGGKSSFRWFVNEDAPQWMWDAFNQALKENGSNKSVYRADDIWALSPEEMEILRNYAPAAWRELLDQDGEANPEDLLNEYIGMSGKSEELLSNLNEKLTGYTFEGFKDNFTSMLADMSSDVDDFGDNMEKTLSNAVLKSMMNKKFKDRIDALYKEIAKAAEDDDITQQEADNIREMNEKLSQDMIDERKRLLDLGIIKDTSNSSKEQQSATFNSAKNITYEQADALVGIATAQQIILEQIKAWLYEQDFGGTQSEEGVINVEVPEVEVTQQPAESRVGEILDNLKEEAGEELQKAAEALYAASQQRIKSIVELDNINLQETDNEDLVETMKDSIDSLRHTLGENIEKLGEEGLLPPTIDVEAPVIESNEQPANYDELMDTFRNSFGKVMVSLKSVAAKVGVNIPTTALQGIIPQQAYDSMTFEEQFNSILESVKEQVGDNLTSDSDEVLDMTDLKAMMVENSIANEQNTAQVMLISQNLQALKEMTTANSIVVSEIRNLVMEGNSTREAMLKVMRERYESFDSKLSQIYRELLAQG